MKAPSQLNAAGILLFLAGSLSLMGIITGEIYYPTEYSTFKNEISDLGGTRPPNSIIHQPSATIFNLTMMATGILILIATYFLLKHFKKSLAVIPLAIFGLGILGVGIFPGHVEFWHGLFAMITFIFGGLACITALKIVTGPYRFIGIFCGITSLVFYFGAGNFIPYLGMGGTERWVAYPILLWLTGLGGRFLGTKNSV